MKRQKAVQQRLTALAVLMLTLFFVCLSPQTAPADPSKDYVIVIDVSTSMQDIFDEVKQLAKQTLKEARVGDNVAVITFGEDATLLQRKQIRGKSDIEGLQKDVDDLYPTDYSTYINRGLEKGLSELRYLFEKHPNRERVLLWLSDDKDNPPELLGNDFLTLDKLREKQRDFEPEREWFAYNAPLSEVKSDVLEDFVTWARRTTFRIAVKEDSVDLGSFEDGDVKKKILLTFQPRHPGAAGLELSAKARLTDPQDPSRALPVSMSPQRIVASGHLWQQEFQVAFAGEPGEYEGEFYFESISGPILDVEPRKINFTAMIVAPKVAVVEPEKPVEKPKPGGLLADAKERGIIATEDRPPGLTRPEKPLEFGPLEPGKKDSKIITLFLNKEANPDGITQDLSIQLPDGINIESEVFGRGTRLAAEITISVNQDASVSADVLESAYEGSMRFKSDETGVEVLPVYVPIRVALNTDRVRWGRRLLPETKVDRLKARQMTFEELTKELEAEGEEKGVNPIVGALRTTYSKIGPRYVILPLLGALVVLLAILFYRMRPVSELFVGELVIIKDPSDSKMKNVNLKRSGSLHGKDVLTIGSSPKADIRLNHESVLPIHCKISARTNEDQTEIAIHPLKGCLLKVNDVERSEKTNLSDKDLIGVGDFILLFSNPETQKEVVVHFLDGRTTRGTPVTWDIGAASFELLGTDSGGLEETTEEITVINFTDLKAVFFMQDVSGSRPSIPRDRISTGELLEVTFFDGEKIEGHPLNDYSEVTGRFYLVPREMPNIISILVERNNAKEIVKKEFRGEPEVAEPTGLFGFLRKRKGTAPAE